MLLGERFEKFEAIGGLISLGGVVFIAKPTFLLGSAGDSASAIERTKGVCAGLLNTVGSSLVYVTLRKIGKRAHPLMCNSFFAIWCVIGSVAAVITLPDVYFIIPKTALEWCLLGLLGIAGFIFQYLMTAAVQREKTSIVAAMTYTMLLWSLLAQYLIWHTTPDIWSWLGISLIVGGALYIATTRMRRSPEGNVKPTSGPEPEAIPLTAIDLNNEDSSTDGSDTVPSTPVKGVTSAVMN
jgi:drug/metabolite transporter (DMT)-like permease